MAALGKVPQNYDPLRAAFYVSDDYTSLASLQLHYRDLDLLIPEALHAVSADGRLDADQDAETRRLSCSRCRLGLPPSSCP